MTKTVIDKFKPWFGFLFDKKGFQICPPGELEFIADGHVELKANAFASSFKIRFIIDRLQPFVEIGPDIDSGEWFDLALVRALVDGGEFLQITAIDILGQFLETNYSQVAALFACDNLEATLTSLHALERKWAKEMFPRAFGG